VKCKKKPLSLVRKKLMRETKLYALKEKCVFLIISLFFLFATHNNKKTKRDSLPKWLNFLPFGFGQLFLVLNLSKNGCCPIYLLHLGFNL
jgi:hypothetical protein